MFRSAHASLLGSAVVFILFVPVGCSQLQSLTQRSPQSAAADIQFAFGQTAERNGDFNGAVAAYKKVLEEDDTKFEAYHRLALLHDKRGDNVAAAAFYPAAAELAPDIPEIHCDWGYNCYLREQWVDAESHLRTAIQLRPDFERAHNNLAVLLARQGRTNEALQEFARAGATEAQARSNIAFAMMLEGQIGPAKAQLDMAQRLPSGANRPAVAELQRIAEIASVNNSNRMACVPLPPVR